MTALIVALLVLGASLLVAEAHVASYGILGVAGVALLALAGVLAVRAAGGSVALALVVPVAAVTIALVFIGGGKALAVSRLRPKGGADGLIGQVGAVRRTVAPVGDILVEGELWRARRSLADDERALSEGEHVVVESVRGLTLSVPRAEEWELLP